VSKVRSCSRRVHCSRRVQAVISSAAVPCGAARNLFASEGRGGVFRFGIRAAYDRHLSSTKRHSPPLPPKIFRLPWNVIENKGPKMRKMGQMRLPWNVYENKQLNCIYPGMLLINKVVSRISAHPQFRM
jgi:hypothetical protein